MRSRRLRELYQLDVRILLANHHERKFSKRVLICGDLSKVRMENRSGLTLDGIMNKLRRCALAADLFGVHFDNSNFNYF